MTDYLITGGAGFIGSHLVERLLAAGDRVTVLDNFSSGKRENLPNDSRIAIVAEDLLALQPGQLQGSFAGVVHLAALPSVNDSWAEPGKAHALNLSATVRLIELARELGIPRVVFASSAAVYGEVAIIPVTENHRLRPVSPYGLQKFASEEYGRLFAGEDFSFLALRLFNVFGPRQLATSPYSGVISRFVSAMRENQPITIFGDGRQTRDFVYVKDIAEGIRRGLTTPDLGPFTVCNLGCGEAVSVLQLIETVRPFFPEWPGEVRHEAPRLGDIARSQSDISAAQRLLSYRREYSLESGLAEMLTGENERFSR